MFKILSILIILRLFGGFEASNQNKSNKLIVKNDSISIEKLKSINFHFYIGKEIACFLEDKMFSKYKDRFFIQEPPGVLQLLSLKYSDKIFVEIGVTKYRHLKPFNMAGNWSMKLYKKEKLSIIRIIIDNKVVKVIK